MNIGSSPPLQQLTPLKECFSINDVRTLVAKQLRVDIEPPWPIEQLEQKVANAYLYGKEPIGARSAQADFDAVDVETGAEGWWSMLPRKQARASTPG